MLRFKCIKEYKGICVGDVCNLDYKQPGIPILTCIEKDRLFSVYIPENFELFFEEIKKEKDIDFF